MAGQTQDQFEVYFRKADLDGDGRISGAEAVSFFQGSGLSKQVLAQIWAYADQSHSGFLSKQDFFNALKLVTVAQRRELTPDIVKAALYGPAAAKIPAPQINLPATSAPQMGAAVPPSSPSVGFRGPGVPNAGMSQQHFPSQQNLSMRPQQTMPAATVLQPSQGIAAPEFSRGGNIVGQPQAMPAGSTPLSHQSMPTVATGPSLTNQNMSSNWLSGRPGGASTGPQGVAPSTAPRPQAAVSMSSQPTANDSKALVVSGNGLASGSAFGSDAFSATSFTPKQELSTQTFSPHSAPASPGITPVSSGAQPLVKSNSLDSLQSTFSMHSAGSQSQRPYTSSIQGQPVSSPSSSFTPSGISAGAVNADPNSSQPPWPKMKQSDVQKYMKVFMEVDTDRDGKIIGEQARNLFLSWRLPREVLKQVWDLSDQDSDSMLSLREFCFALYLMERYREGRPLPLALPRNVLFDETLLSMTGQPNVSYGNAAWGPNPGFGHQSGMPAQTMTPSAGVKPPVRPNASADTTTMSNQQKPREPVLDDSFGTQPNNNGQNLENGAAGDVDGTEKVILDSREKLEFYREKMQELVLYKSRCDNRLNEITERAIADKREAEMLAKKYEEKYKQVAEIASKLTVEEAKFREIQERKTELHHAIVNMEQGGSADGILQVRADRIQSDLEELMKALTERCKKHGYDVKSAAVIELPTGWQPGVPEGAALWDEEWDKFEDEGFGNELTIDVKKGAVSQRGKASPDGSLTPDSTSYADEKTANLFSAGERAIESESAYTHSEDESARSPRGSPTDRNSLESPSKPFSDDPFGKSTEAEAERHQSLMNQDGGPLIMMIWTLCGDSDKARDFFGSSDFDVHTRTESPNAESFYDKKSPFTFEDSVPSTPLSKFGNSPSRFSEASRDQFDSFSRFDSFSMHDGGFSQQPDRLTRFDSINSSKDFGSGFSSFDSINNSKDFGSGFSPQPETFTRFDTISSSKDFGHGFSFDDSDPFGSSGPFKVSSDQQSPKKSSDNWRAF
ncbi:hypothetical protein CXB51_001005 [Gossypium anomalum]|uniref:Uncharacterized protein n=1 Tax=Gossypium anomalum TaxID=47600 RepID=A0A8J6DES3_9ROSI|nr:hypothetical protein CXB51_001005 [Gossypium anomalum]